MKNVNHAKKSERYISLRGNVKSPSRVQSAFRQTKGERLQVGVECWFVQYQAYEAKTRYTTKGSS